MQENFWNAIGYIAILQARIRQLENRLALYEPPTTYLKWLDGPHRILPPDIVQKLVDLLRPLCLENGVTANAPKRFIAAVLPEFCTHPELLRGLADACSFTDVPRDRKRFVTYYEHLRQEILVTGITPEQIMELDDFRNLVTDSVTKYWEGRSGKARFWTLRQAIRHVKETGEIAVYVTMDLKNLGGLNDALGHTEANQVYSEIAAAVGKELSAVASDSTFFRHGGDETSAFLMDTSEQAILAAFANLEAQVEELAQEYGVQGIPHPKHPGDGRFRGIGIHYGICRIRLEHENDPTSVFREAEADSKQRKDEEP